MCKVYAIAVNAFVANFGSGVVFSSNLVSGQELESVGIFSNQPGMGICWYNNFVASGNIAPQICTAQV
jgi:hypothetical protein